VSLTLCLLQEVQRIAVELLRILQEGKMADVRLYEQFRAGISFAMNSVFSRLIASSWSPSTIQTGTLIACSFLAVKSGCVAHILVISSRKEL